MKKILFLILSIFMVTNLLAFVLPEGSDARINAIEKNEEGKIISAVFSHPSEINTPIGRIMATGTVYFDENGNVIEFYPAENGTLESPIGKINYLAESPLSFFSSGTLKSAVLSFESQIKHGKRVYPITQKIVFYNDWIPQSLVLSKDKSVTLPLGTITCAAGSMIKFYTSGEIKSFCLAEESELSVGKDKKIMAKGEVIVSKGGKVLSAFVTKCFPLKTGMPYPVSDIATTFYNDGNLKSLVSDEIMEVEVDGKKLITVPNTEIVLNKKGMVQKATVAGNVSFYDWNIEKSGLETTFIRYANGDIVLFDAINTGWNSENLFYILNKEKCFSVGRYCSVKEYSRDNFSNPKQISFPKMDKNEKLKGFFEKEYVKEKAGSFTYEDFVNCWEVGAWLVPTYLNKQGEIDFVNSPFIFSEIYDLIGVRAGILTYGDIYVSERKGFSEIEILGGYEKDFFFDENKNKE